MSKLKDQIMKRLTKSEDAQKKMEMLAQKAAYGSISSFTGVFKVEAPSEQDLNVQINFLEKSSSEPISKHQLEEDAKLLSAIEQEVRAINCQAVLLHGERIKKAQQIMLKYQEGTFTKWLIKAYGNRQTPYNMLQYYDFFQNVPQEHRHLLENAPKQAVYCLASRNGSIDEKVEILKDLPRYSKKEFLELVRERLPINKDDKRRGHHPLIKILKEAEVKAQNLECTDKETIYSALKIIEKIEAYLIKEANSRKSE